MSCAKIAELIRMPFGMWTWVGMRKVLDGVQIPTSEGAIFGQKVAGLGHVHQLIYRLSKWQNQYDVALCQITLTTC